MTPQELYHELAYYTLALQDPAFIHQHIVDAQTAQTADTHTKPIGMVFALAGLYLTVEKNFTGRQVQLMHMKMAKNKTVWPGIILPSDRGAIRVADVLSKLPGPERDEMIHQWCLAVWNAYRENHKTIRALMEGYIS